MHKVLIALLVTLAPWLSACSEKIDVNVAVDEILIDEADSVITYVIYKGSVTNNSKEAPGLFSGPDGLDIDHFIVRLNMESENGIHLTGGSTYLSEAESRVRYNSTVPFELVVAFFGEAPPRSFYYEYWGEFHYELGDEDFFPETDHIRVFHSF